MGWQSRKARKVRQTQPHAVSETRRSSAGHSSVYSDRRCAHRRETLPVSVLLFSPADARKHPIDVALCAGALPPTSAAEKAARGETGADAVCRDLSSEGEVAVPIVCRISQVVWKEIGRASCRERSVDLGGRRIIKKK